MQLAVSGVLMHAGYLGGVWSAVKAGIGAARVGSLCVARDADELGERGRAVGEPARTVGTQAGHPRRVRRGGQAHKLDEAVAWCLRGRLIDR